MTYQLVLRAANFAADKHRFQTRKDHHASPYINHPLKVAEILAEVGGITDEEILAAALLHDTIEDTETTREELDAAFGARVRQIVEQVTDDKTLPKAERKRLQVEHAAHLSPDAVPVKLADKIANVTDITHNPPAGWSMDRRMEYLEWAEAVVGNCAQANEPLLAHFSKSVAVGRETLVRS